MKKKTSCGKLGIRWKLFAYLTVFTVILLVALWVVQIRLLSWFYGREKNRMLHSTAQTIQTYLEQDAWDIASLTALVEQNAADVNACIEIYTMSGDTYMLLAEANVTSVCVIHGMNDTQIAELYEKAVQNRGTYSRSSTVKASDSTVTSRSSTVNMVYARVQSSGDTQYLLLLDSAIKPYPATVRTLRVQFAWISVCMLFAAFVLAFVVSHMIAKPLTVLTKKARQLAEGEYKTDFTSHGYREVRELSEALNFAASEISQTDRLQKELIANVSHDLRTPLTMIRGYGEMMRDIPGENSPENVQVIIDETTRLSNLVNDLMDLSKLQAGTKNPDLAVFDLAETVRDAMHRYDTLIQHKGYHIEVEAEEEAFVCADRTMILQVMYNLINNAINYTGESRRVRVSETVRDGVVRVAVADDGEGIPSEQIPEIWDRYYRVDKVHKSAVIGTGLGLSIVKSVLEAHLAHYGVDSAVGVGSVFWFELPLVPPDDKEKIK